jgi:hypothetical protein
LWRSFIDRRHQSVLQHSGLQKGSDQLEHPSVGHALGHRRYQAIVIYLVEGTYDTLPIIRTFPSESRLSVLVIRSRVNHSLFLRPSIGTVDCISF